MLSRGWGLHCRPPAGSSLPALAAAAQAPHLPARAGFAALRYSSALQQETD